MSTETTQKPAINELLNPENANTGERGLLVEKTLVPEVPKEIDTSLSFPGSDEVLRELGLRGNIVAGIRAADKPFFLVDVSTDPHYNADYLLIDQGFQRDIDAGYLGGSKGIRKNEEVTIGRVNHEDRFEYTSGTSRKHFKVTYDDKGLSVTDLGSTYGTTLIVPSPEES